MRMRNIISAVSVAGEVKDPLPKFNKMLVKMVGQVMLLCIFCAFMVENAALRSENEADENYISAKKRSLNLINVVNPPLNEKGRESHSKLFRHRRFPIERNSSSIENAMMECTLRFEVLICEIRCIPGHAMEEDGKVVRMTTRQYQKSEKVWYPNVSFPVCKPFINCKAILTKPGDLDCKISGPMISYCDISCKADYEHDEVTKKRYECLDENYASTLPHCATLAKDVHLIQPPQDFRKAIP